MTGIFKRTRTKETIVIVAAVIYMGFVFYTLNK